MKKKLYWHLLALLLGIFAVSEPLSAYHIVGGEMTYECLGGNQYEITLIVYRDCNCTNCAEYDDPAYIFIFNNTNNTSQKLSVPFPGSNPVYPPDDICITTLPDVCVEEARYQTIVSLPPTTGGYTLVYQRYSRNSTIVNIAQPDQTGSSYLTDIPPAGLATCNDSPVFNSFPPTVICANTPIFIDQSASDANGDSLVYELCDPLVGGDNNCVQPGNPDCPTTSPPPYDPVNWIFPYNASNPLAGPNPLSINPQTGLLTGVAPTIGQYVVAICVSEYRNGELINQIRRDFQFNVADCQVVSAGAAADSISAQGDYYITDCSEDYTVQFVNQSIGGISYNWNFGDPTATDDFSTLQNPSYTYPDTGLYVIRLITIGQLTSCIDTAYIYLKLYPTLTPNFNYVPQCANVPIVFTDLSTSTYGTINSWAWSFDDGSFSDQPSPQHAFAAGGTYNVELLVKTDLGCVRAISLPVTVYPTPIANFSTTLKCPGQPIDFSDISTGATISTWQWNFGDPASGTANNSSTIASPQHVYNTPGAYTATMIATSSNGCSDTIAIPFEIYNYFTADAGPNVETCAGVPAQLAASEEYDWFTYQWSPATGLSSSTISNPTATLQSTTTYTVTISDPNGCSDTDVTTVSVNPLPNVTISGDTVLCAGSSATLNAQYPSNTVQHTWTGGSLNDPVNTTVTVQPDVPTWYVFSIIDNKGCSNADSLWLDILYPVTAQVSPAADICQSDTLQLTASGGTAYQWLPTAGLDNPLSATPLAYPSQSTTYQVIVTNACFSDTISVPITVRPLPNIDAGVGASINIGETTVLNGSSDGDYAYVWLPDAGLSGNNTVLTPTAQPLLSTTYTLQATSEYGCMASDTVHIDVSNIFNISLPNAFSPNGDNVNDVFRIVDFKGIKSMSVFRIYNRWGQLLFETNNAEVGWDGIFKGIAQEMGVYVCYVEAVTFLDEPFIYKGNITLVR